MKNGIKSHAGRLPFSSPAALLLLAISAYPCLWPVGERYRVGKPIDLEDLSATEYVQRITTTEGRDFWNNLLQQLHDQKKDHPAMDNDNNVAVALVHLGRYQEALEILKKAEKKYSDTYFTAANLGTTYELLGQNGQALQWIKRGLSRDPESHFGTEWIHVKILETKIALEEDPRWLERRSVLGIDWDDANRNPSVEISVTDSDGRRRSAKEIEDALAYQLHERMEFVKPPDPVVAQLLFDLSNLVRRSKSAEHGDAVLKLAIDYGHKAVPPAAAGPLSTTTVFPVRPNIRLVGVIVAIALASVIGYVYYRRRKRLRWQK